MCEKEFYKQKKRELWRKEKQTKDIHEASYPQFFIFRLFFVYKSYFNFSNMPKAGVGVKSNLRTGVFSNCLQIFVESSKFLC